MSSDKNEKKYTEDIQIGKEEVKLPLFEEDLIIYVENVMKPTKKAHRANK